LKSPNEINNLGLISVPVSRIYRLRHLELELMIMRIDDQGARSSLEPGDAEKEGGSVMIWMHAPCPTDSIEGERIAMKAAANRMFWKWRSARSRARRSASASTVPPVGIKEEAEGGPTR
jgi:hypothetical protein